MHRYRYLTIIALALAALLTACLPRTPQPTGSLAGTVVAEDGSPLAGAELVLMREGSAPDGQAVEATSDEAGAFLMEGVRVGVYNLTAIAAPTGGTPTGAYLEGIEVEEDAVTNVELVAAPLGAVAGTLLLDDDPSSEGAVVQLLGTPLAAEVAANGDYALAGVPGGTYRVRFAAPGYGAVELPGVEVAPGETTALPLTTLVRVAPSAAFTATVTGTTVEVDASRSRDPRGAPLTYRWEFGDGTRLGPDARAVRATHSYRSGGPFTITLTVTNPSGHSDTASLEVEIFLPRLTAGQQHARTVPAQSEASWEVRIPASLRGELLYFEVEGAPAIEVEFGGATHVSTTPDSFRRLASGAGPLTLGEGALAPQAISVGRVCRGPCVIVPNGGGVAVLRVHNPSPVELSVIIYLPAEAVTDLNEPANDSRAGATSLTDLESGAIELVGDVDWFVAQRSGRLLFDGARGLQLEARLYDASGARLTTLQGGASANVAAGDFVEVVASRAEAGPSGSSEYHLTLD